MKTLDRYILRSLLYSTMVWFVVFMTLRTIADLFVNMNQFAQLNLSFWQTLRTIGVYYGYQSLTYFTELGGVIIVASAAFTLAMMNHTNELTAMLASGVSLFRVIVPVVVCSVLLSGLIVLDQEFVIPGAADKLVRERDDVEGVRRFQVRAMPDEGGNIWFAVAYDPNQQTMMEPVVTVRDANGRPLARIMGRQAREANTADGQVGWKFTEGVLSRLKPGEIPWENPPRWNMVYSTIGPEALLQASAAVTDAAGTVHDANVADAVYGMVIRADSFAPGPPALGRSRGGVLGRPRFIFSDAQGRVLGAFLADTATWTPGKGGHGYWALEKGFLFFPSTLSGDDLVLRRSDQWIQYMSTSQLATLLRLKNVPNVEQVLLTRHTRFTEPINNLVMLLLGLPFILSRERNIKSSATLCLLMVGAFFAFIQICRHLDLPPTLSAWLPILLFGPVAAVMLDSVKT
jgi:lipopolysaccharide export LptBFGC system permease protein LptF